jgi:hypothetical protein
MNIDSDILYYISNNSLVMADILSWRSTCKYTYNIMDEAFWAAISISWYGREFWIRALMRPTENSFPLDKWLLELKRIEKFQLCVQRNGSTGRWLNDQFYTLWDYTDKFRKKRRNHSG